LSVFHTLEQEHFDIFAHRLGEVDSNIGSETYGDVAFTRGITQLNHARNDLDALIVNTEIKGFHDWRKNQLEWELSTPVNRFAIESNGK
jgi:hypothetical protein